MAAENVQNNEAGAAEDKISVGSFTFTISPGANARITEQIGDILEAQVILRGSKNLGFGTVTFNTTGGENGAAAVEGDIQGSARLDKAGRGKGKSTRGRGAKKTAAGRARRSADDPSALDDPTSEANAEKGATSVKAVADGLQAAEGTDGAARGGASKRGRGRGAANAKPRQKRERGEPSKTLVYMRNIPYSYTEDKVGELISSKTSVSYSSISLPVHKFGQHKGSRRGFGFVTVSSEEDQNKLIEALEGLELSPEKPSDAPAATTEGGDAKEERKFKLVARKGYENEEKESEKEEGAAAASGEQATAEEAGVKPTDVAIAAPGGATPAMGGHL